MAISPSVQQFQAQYSQGGGSHTQQTFETKLGQLAYDAFRAKYPSLLAYIVTFKVIDANLDTGFGIGTFILAKGSDVIYVPVVLANGTIESCEMLYDKTEDSFTPLTDENVKQLAGANTLTDYSLQKKPPMIESTEELFRRLVRPPMSSNPILASSNDALEILPNSAKEQIVSYLKSNPEVLGKIAAFYPIEKLAEKLASVPEKVITPNNLPTVVSISDLTRDISEKLAAEQKQELITDGFLITKEALDVEAPVVLSGKNLDADLITNFNLTQVTKSGYDATGNAPKVSPELYGTGLVCYLGHPDMIAKPCIIAGDAIVTKDGTFRLRDSASIVIANYSDGITKADLLEFGAVTPQEVTISNEVGTGGYKDITIFYPLNNNRYQAFVSENPYRMYNTEKRVINAQVYLIADQYETLIFNTSGGPIHAGYIKSGSSPDESVIFPPETLIIDSPADKTIFINTVAQFCNTIRFSAPALKLVDDGAGITLRDTSSEKTASFRTKSDLITHLVSTYNFTKEAVTKLLTDREVLVFTKQAFTPQSAVEAPGATENMSGSLYTGMPEQAPPAPEFNPEAINAAADLGDSEIMDTGMLASVAGSEDIKSILVDLMPDFSSTVSHLGQTILIMTLNKTELVDYYGQEPYHTLLNNIRKVFKLLGTIISDLNSYMNMH